MMMRLTLIHALLEEHLISDPDVRVVAHVLSSNQMPRGIIERDLRFKRLDAPVEIPGSDLPGLRADPDGIIRGHEFELVKPDTLQALAAWARSWTGELPDGDFADVELRGGLTIDIWRQALDELASRHAPPAIEA